MRKGRKGTKSVIMTHEAAPDVELVTPLVVVVERGVHPDAVRNNPRCNDGRAGVFLVVGMEVP